MSTTLEESSQLMTTAANTRCTRRQTVRIWAASVNAGPRRTSKEEALCDLGNIRNSLTARNNKNRSHRGTGPTCFALQARGVYTIRCRRRSGAVAPTVSRDRVTVARGSSHALPGVFVVKKESGSTEPTRGMGDVVECS
jgi:hypothetical protein